MLFLTILRDEKDKMNKYTRIIKKTKFWAYLSDITGYRKTKRLIYKDKRGEYIIIEGVKKYV